jgi:hypothetical protein
VPFWSPTFSVTEDRLTDPDDEAPAEADVEAAAFVAAVAAEVELLEEEQAVAARPATAMAENATSVFRLRFTVNPSISIVFTGNRSALIWSGFPGGRVSALG